MKSISLAAALALASTVAANTTNAGSQKNDDSKMNDSATTKPSRKDAGTQGAGTAGAVDKKGDATSPGGTMKK